MEEAEGLLRAEPGEPVRLRFGANTVPSWPLEAFGQREEAQAAQVVAPQEARVVMAAAQSS